jgi:hypothetical protein
VRHGHIWIECHSDRATAPLASGSSPRALDKDATDEMCGDPEEMRAILPPHMSLIDQLQVGVVNECRGLERVARPLPAKVMVSETAKFTIHCVKQLVSRVPIPIAPGHEQTGDV